MEQVIKPYIFNYGILGLILLIISFISWAVFYFYYDVELYSSVKPPTSKPMGWKFTGILTLVAYILGLIFSSFTLYGHYLLDKNKTSTFRRVNNNMVYDNRELQPVKPKKYQI